MHVITFFNACAIATSILSSLPHVLAAAAAASVPRIDNTTINKTPYGASTCRYLPGDADWPKLHDWSALNHTIGGGLIIGAPLGQNCHSLAYDANECTQVQEGWIDPQIYYQNPVNVMSPYWLNDTCSPFSPVNASCTMGNLAVYAINVSSYRDVAAAFAFARAKNIRLSIKNTGHDYIGRSNGQGSLALWTHNLKSISFSNYTSQGYTGPAVKLGAGVQAFEVYEAAAANGLRVTGGFCPTVGLAGGYFQGGGHGPLGASYGLGADNTLEFEVVTADGQQRTASRSQNSDLYWALSGGGAGTYAVVISVTVKAHADGPVAGGSMSFSNIDPDTYWAGVEAWHDNMLLLDNITGFSTSFGFDNSAFDLAFATLPGGSESDMNAALAPFFQELEKLNITTTKNETTVKSNFYEHYEHYASNNALSFAPNNSLGGWLISRSSVQNNLTGLVSVFREIVEDPEYQLVRISGISNNLTHARVGNEPSSNAVLPAWRDSLYTLNVGIGFAPDLSSDELEKVQVKVNKWQNLFKPVSPGGAYVNEATFDDPDWKEDYFGENYAKLLAIKMKYDPNFALWQHTSVGADAYWNLAGDGRLCHVVN